MPRKSATAAPLTRPVQNLDESADDYAARLELYCNARNAAIRARVH